MTSSSSSHLLPRRTCNLGRTRELVLMGRSYACIFPCSWPMQMVRSGSPTEGHRLASDSVAELTIDKPLEMGRVSAILELPSPAMPFIDRPSSRLPSVLESRLVSSGSRSCISHIPSPLSFLTVTFPISTKLVDSSFAFPFWPLHSKRCSPSHKTHTLNPATISIRPCTNPYMVHGIAHFGFVDPKRPLHNCASPMARPSKTKHVAARIHRPRPMPNL